MRCGHRLAGPARPVGLKLRAGISVRSGCGGWCREGIERGSVPRLLWEQGNGGSAGHVPVGQWLPCGRWGRSDRGRRMRGRTSHRVGALGGEGISSGSAMPCFGECRMHQPVLGAPPQSPRPAVSATRHAGWHPLEGCHGCAYVMELQCVLVLGTSLERMPQRWDAPESCSCMPMRASPSPHLTTPAHACLTVPTPPRLPMPLQVRHEPQAGG